MIPWYRSPVFTAGLTAFVLQLAPMLDERFFAELIEGKPGAWARGGSLIMTAIVVAVRAASNVQPLTLTAKKDE